MVRQSLSVLLLVLACVACDATVSPPPTSPNEAAASDDPASTQPTITASPSPTPESTPSPDPTPSIEPTPSAEPASTPAPTAEPWQSYRSKRFHYTIRYPSNWDVTPGDSKHTDTFGSFDYPYVYVSRDTVPSGIASVSKTVPKIIAKTKKENDVKLISNKAITLAGGYKGRILTFRGTGDLFREMTIKRIIVAKGRTGYFIDLYGLTSDASKDAKVFQKIYGAWRPTG